MATNDLRPLPDGFATTRDALHQLAFFAIAPKRYANTERMGLTATKGGFGTPPWSTESGEESVRMEGATLVHEVGTDRRTSNPTTVREATDFLGLQYTEDWFADFHDPLAPVGPDTVLTIDETAALVLADWFAFATEVLDEVRATEGAVDVSMVQLWPEHFDTACEMGSQDTGQRGSYGGSPGDRDHDEPYLYVAAWDEIDRSNEYWNDSAFNGASISYAELLEANDARTTAVDFLRRGHAILTKA